MPSRYTDVRRQWHAIDPERDLTRIWRTERMEHTKAVEETLRVYEIAIHAVGWEEVKRWASQAFSEGRLLNTHLTELAMRAFEQRDISFVVTITTQLQKQSPAGYFRFWYTLFATRHSHAGERLFREQLASLDDYQAVKYRRWLRKILRKLRFRCKTPHEKALGAIAFGKYRTYEKKTYPSEVFEAYIAVHKIAHTRPKNDKNRPVSKALHAVLFGEVAAKLGIWSVVEGVRTSAKIDRTRAYLALMAPCMTDLELRRSLKIFDETLRTKSHQKEPHDVIALAEYLKKRLWSMKEVSLDEWAKVYPYLQSKLLRGALEDILDDRLAKQSKAFSKNRKWGFGPLLVPETLEARSFRASLLASYLQYDTQKDATLYLLQPTTSSVLTKPSPLWPYGEGRLPNVSDWQNKPDREHRVFYELIRQVFPLAANRRTHSSFVVGGYLQAFRHHLYRRYLLDGGVQTEEVPLLFFSEEPPMNTRPALLAYLGMFPAAVLVLPDIPWSKPLDASHLIHLTPAMSSQELFEALSNIEKKVLAAQEQFASRKSEVDRAVRHLALSAPPHIGYISQGPFPS